jgi:phosphoribosyl-dephospho-CoA transferase
MIAPVPQFTGDTRPSGGPPVSPATSLRTHDIVRIEPWQVTSEGEPIPDWVNETLLHCPFAVVRRGPAVNHRLPIGVRGATRAQRWGGFYPAAAVRQVVRPPDLQTRAIAAARAAAIPALCALRQLHEQWQDVSLPWGPGGSVGFELAAGRPVATPGSDLDLILYADVPLAREHAYRFLSEASHLAAVTDLRVETPRSGFSLGEYVTFLERSRARLLLRTPHGVVLGADPWG